MRIETKRRPATGEDTPAAVAMGFFDGVHLGHQAVIGAARDYAVAHGLRLAVFTFGQGPKGDGLGRHLQSDSEKHRQLAALGVDTCYQPDFGSFSFLAPEDFYRQMLLGEYNAKALFCGEDFAFAAHRAGNVALLKTLCAQTGVALGVVPTTFYKGEPVSSSRIRAALEAGNIPEVNAMLGRPYEIDFAVERGQGLGHTLGTPTINQRFPADLQPPPFGVYITQTLLDGKAWPSATGFGTRPTVDGGSPSCETFIPGYTGDLYGENVRVRFFERIAPSRKFADTAALGAAVQDWGHQAKAYFAANGQPLN